MTPTVRSDRLGSCESGLGSELWKSNICSSFLCSVSFCALSKAVSPLPPHPPTPPRPLITLLIMIFPKSSHFVSFSLKIFSFNCSWTSLTLLPSSTSAFCWYLTSIISYICASGQHRSYPPLTSSVKFCWKHLSCSPVSTLTISLNKTYVQFCFVYCLLYY